jgi:hypothetical protein
MAWALIFVACTPAVMKVGTDSYRLNCLSGITECRQTAGRVCPLGFDIEEASTAATGEGSMLVRCARPKEPKPVPPVHVVLDEQCPAPMPEGVECVRNFQCSGEAARCIDGKCVAATTTQWFEPATGANATTSGTDGGTPASGWSDGDAGAPPP